MRSCVRASRAFPFFLSSLSVSPQLPLPLLVRLSGLLLFTAERLLLSVARVCSPRRSPRLPWVLPSSDPSLRLRLRLRLRLLLLLLLLLLSLLVLLSLRRRPPRRPPSKPGGDGAAMSCAQWSSAGSIVSRSVVIVACRRCRRRRRRRSPPPCFPVLVSPSLVAKRPWKIANAILASRARAHRCCQARIGHAKVRRGVGWPRILPPLLLSPGTAGRREGGRGGPGASVLLLCTVLYCTIIVLTRVCAKILHRVLGSASFCLCIFVLLKVCYSDYMNCCCM